MSETQLYIAAGLPTVAVLVGILMNVSLFNSLSARLLPWTTRWTQSWILSPESWPDSTTASPAWKSG
jgi:hypothetical protein